jgi:hypothetical protein
VRFRPVRSRGRARIAVVSGASGSSALAGRLPQCLQQVSAIAWERTRDSTAVKESAPGSRPAPEAACAAMAAIMLRTSSSAQAS